MDTEGRWKDFSSGLGAAFWMELPGASGPFLHFLQQKSVSRRKCAACKIVVHTPCIEQLEKVSVSAQPFLPVPFGCCSPLANTHVYLCTDTPITSIASPECPSLRGGEEPETLELKCLRLSPISLHPFIGYLIPAAQNKAGTEWGSLLLCGINNGQWPRQHFIST